MKYLLTLTFTIFIFCNTLSQGKLMLVGGGTELDDSWSWSNTPYQWAVNQSANKKVAIVAFGESSDPEWLPNYFISLGAVAAKNFVIDNIDSANSQVTYDTLMKYDVFFFKGGDQSNYYETYKNSKVTEAITDKFGEGGVVAGTSAGMAIISEIVYTAQNGTLYPDQALKNVNHENITLANDFLTIFNDYVVDTHFIERGRLPRLAAFIGNWYLNEGQQITGIGVDDRTAFCIDENNIGTAYGTGAITLLTTDHFETQNSKPLADSIHMVALLHNQQYNLTTKEILNELSVQVEPTVNEETGKYTLYLAGISDLNANQNLLSEILLANDTVIIVSNHQNTQTNDYIDHIEGTNVTVFPLYTAESTDSCSTALARNMIKLTDKFIFLDNDLATFNNFLSETATGKVLNQKIRQDHTTSIFLGEDAKLAGTYYVTNNTADELNAYYGNLEFAEGAGLLKTTTIIPDAYDPASSDFYENNTASALFMPVQFNLKHAALINRNSYIKYFSANDSTWFNSFGNYSSILITNNASTGGFADQQVNSDGDVRQVAGYDQLKISLIDDRPVFVGIAKTNDSNLNSSLELLAPSDVEASFSDAINLSWSDNSENENTFIIERKSAGGDFDLLVELTEDSELYSDTNIETGITYEYRIQAVGDEMVSCYSNIASVDVITGFPTNSKDEIRVYPNPVLNETIYVKCNLDGFAELYNQFGQLVLKQKLNKGITTIKVSELPSGILYLRLISSSRTIEENYFSILNTK